MTSASTEVEVEQRRLKLSNLTKVLYPAAGFTKAQVIDYYMRIGPAILPHLHNRPLTLKRYPNGVEGEFFYEKSCPSHRPGWVKTVPVWSESSDRTIDFCLANDLPTLAWLANLAALELHTSLSLARDVSQPTMVVFDLDPGEGTDIVQCCHVALWLRDLFADIGLECFAKTSGSKGLQPYVPLNTPVTYETTKPFANVIARLIEKDHPKQVTSNMRKDLRKGKVFIDWSQNDEHKTTVCVYSLRARERPTVSTPVTWDEVEACAKQEDASLLRFEADEVVRRFEERGDLFAPVLAMKQKLPSL